MFAVWAIKIKEKRRQAVIKYMTVNIQAGVNASKWFGCFPEMKRES